MASEKPDKKEKREKKDKKRSESDGVHKAKKEKKEKKDKKDKLEHKLSSALDDQLQAEVALAAAKSGIVATPRDELNRKLDAAPALVPFAIPLADEKAMKKTLKTIRKSAKANTLKRGVKEVVKALRKSPPAAPGNTSFPGVVVIAGDISPMDVISHLPVLCEDHNVPYIFVSSRAELGAAAKTKRPTSVVLVLEKAEGKPKKKKEEAIDEEEEDGEDFGEAYSSLVKLVQKETAKQSFW